MNSKIVAQSTSCFKLVTSARTYIVQWGTTSSEPVNNQRKITYSQPFTTVPSTNAIITSQGNGFVARPRPTTTVLTVNVSSWTSSDTPNSTIQWFAIGY